MSLYLWLECRIVNFPVVLIPYFLYLALNSRLTGHVVVWEGKNVSHRR